jgi:hypothetical protein
MTLCPIDEVPRTESATPSYREAMLATRSVRRPAVLTASIGLSIAVLVSMSVAPALAAPSTTTAPAPTAAASTSTAYRMDLGRRSDFVAQTNLVQCVGASMQMMLNMMDVVHDRTAATQLRLQRVARANSGPRPDGRERRGASVFGWAAGLELFGGGRYMVIGSTTIAGALLEAAKAIRLTDRPVGLLMWRGRHAWVMSGFRATKDPLLPGARVTSVIVEDPLYPRDSRTWGPSPAPGARLTVAALAKQFVPRRLSTRAPWLSGMYVVVIPYDIQHPNRR